MKGDVQMRVLNTNTQPKTNFGRFAIPGFRSGSTVKKVIALMYYFFVLILMLTITFAYLSGEFDGGRDVLAFVATILIIFAILITPILAIGFSDYYDWHGIRLFLVIMVPFCVLFTLGNYVGTMFSETYINSINPQAFPAQTDVVSESDAETTLDTEIVKEGIGSDGE